MLDHHIQRAIVYKLALNLGLRFSELKPADLENKLFDYHLKKVISAGYVVKNSDGKYTLSPEGRRLGVHVLENVQALMDRAYSVLFLAVRRKSDGAWLMYKRKNHPLKDRVGFMHATPNADEYITETAARECRDRTGLDCSFTVRGSGYFRVFSEQVLESFTNFTLLVCETASGEVRQQDRLAEYFWTQEIDERDEHLLPNMKLLLAKYRETDELFFVDKTIKL